MRTRTKGSLKTITLPQRMQAYYVPFTYTAGNGQTVSYGQGSLGAPTPYSGAYTISGFGSYESISDELKFRNGTGNCSHIKIECLALPSVGPVILSSTRRKVGPDTTQYADYINNVVLPTQAWAASARNAYKSMAGFDISKSPHGQSAVYSDDVQLDRQLVARVMSEISSLQLAVSVAELRDFPALYRMFTSRGALWSFVSKSKDHANVAYIYITNYKQYMSVRDVLRVFSAARGSVRKAVRDLLALNREITLNWCFGLQPTLNDIAKIQKELNSSKKDAMFKGRTLGVRKTTVSTVSHGPSGITPAITWDVRASLTTTTTTIRSCHIRYKPDSNLSTAVSAANRWVDRYVGTSLYQTVWALFPLSFAIDWVLNIDDVLDALFLSTQDRYAIDWRWSQRIDRQIVGSFKARTGLKPSQSTSNAIVNDYIYTNHNWYEGSSSFLRVPTSAPAALSLAGSPKASLKKLYLAALIACGLRRR